MENDERWLAVIARALAFLCLDSADLKDKGLLPKAKLLETFGLNRQEAAKLLGTTSGSLNELFSRERRGARKKGKRGKTRR